MPETQMSMVNWGGGEGGMKLPYCIAETFVDLCSATKVFFVNFWGCGTRRRGVACNTEFRNTRQAFWRMRTQGVISPLMSLLKYFQTNSSLPRPDGPLSMVVSSSSIVAEVKQVA